MAGNKLVTLECNQKPPKMVLKTYVPEGLSSNNYRQLLHYLCLADRFKRSLHYDA